MRTEEENRSIFEDFKIWKRNTPFLYDLVITRALEWLSLTVDWLPDREEPPEKDYSVQKLILGTRAEKNHQNYLILAQIKLPVENDEDDHHHHLPEDTGIGIKVEIVQQIIHDGEINRARHMPQNPFIIATKTCEADVNVFDYSKHPNKPLLDGTCNPDIRLKGHSTVGSGLSWNPFKNGHLLSGSDDSSICIWDVNATPQNKDLDYTQIYKIHEGPVLDVAVGIYDSYHYALAWHLRHEYLFGSVGDDQYLHMWDIRAPSVTKPSQSVVAHEQEVTCLAFNPFDEWLVATGSLDATVKLFDLRRLNNASHILNFHKEDVYQVGWSPMNKDVLASCSRDRRLFVWDVNRIGDIQTPEDAKEGPPELLFIHGGHTSTILDFSWNPCEDWVIASVSDDNILQIWQMTESVFDDVDDLP